MNKHTLHALYTIIFALLVTGCGGSGGGGADDSATDMAGDDARRAVLADIGNEVIIPKINNFRPLADQLATAMSDYAQNNTVANKQLAQVAWRDAMAAFSFLEVLQVGPAADDMQMGGKNLRDLMYFWPTRNLCVIDNSAYAGQNVSAATRADAMGLGALEYLLFFTGDNQNCPPDSTVNREQARADYASKIAAFIATQAAELQNSWAANGQNFINEWSTAGNGSQVYATPQEALNDLSVALFYLEKNTKDNKIACPTGIGATGLVCTGNDIERAEHPFGRVSLASMRANTQAFRDSFTGLNGGMGINDLLTGMGRDDLAAKIITELDDVLTHLDNRIGPAADGFETAVAAINDANSCTNASANPNGGAANPAACSLHGLVKIAMDTFRGPIVAALALKTPDSAAGDND